MNKLWIVQKLKDGTYGDWKLFRKEVKKVKPYFEIKVAKVGKPKPKLFMCKSCGTILPAEKPKGNWVNGENLDKIKFPCFCSYIFGGHKRFGEIDKNWDDIAYNFTYRVSDRTQQTKGLSVAFSYSSLEKMFIRHKIKILKGKIIIFEEE